MQRLLIVLVAICLVGAGPAAFTAGDEAGSTATNPWTDRAQATALIRSYLARAEYDSTLDTTGEYPMFTVPVEMTNATHRLRIVIDSERQMVYLFLNRYLTARPDSPQLPRVLQRLMEENWNLNIGKFEWDKTDKEVRLSYCFTTENGLGYEAFEAVFETLLATGDRLWPELRELTGE